MRRLIIVEPPIRSALWSRRLAVFGLALAAVAAVASRMGAVDPPGALAVLAIAFAFAVLALGAAVLAAVLIWRTGRPGIGAALGGSALALLLLAYPVYLAQKAAHLPAISDISTDPANPLPFSHSPAALAARRGVTREPPTAADRQAQAAAYPDVHPLSLEALPADVQRVAIRLIRKRRWRIIEVQTPTTRSPTGSIEAVARTTLMGFPDDIMLRIAAVGAGQTRVDMRSVSRFGHRDLGANAARIESFLADLEDAVDQE